ncbi:hypothetical protein [Rhodococcus tukisamuensis]|uniref:Alpha/beta hydrolase family protein n=1 Tax=Rhodococcus tukisamuensis TaxID=168276 RepID=A0A1G6XAR5_9NOCA|nr:hypothetical protein [Rhodococcus tukisamuensis]SDD75274.1 hypothetical protein SAMN05444580_106149 [Rhodococcus tukisamuensis]
MKIVFLHGIGDGDPAAGWLEGLNRGLVRDRFEPIDQADTCAPRYASFLSTDGISAKLPATTYKAGDETTGRREFERRQARVRRVLGLDPVSSTVGFHRVPEQVLDPTRQAALRFVNRFDLPQVRRYVGSEAVRGAVLRRILDQIPATGEIMLIGHSLGSVIAIDLLDHLPAEVHVRRFITIGSPANAKVLHEGSERLLKKFPYRRVDDWTNFLNIGDHVTGGRGLGATFTAAQDFRIEVGLLEHSAAAYLGHESATRLIADLLYPTKVVALRSSAVAVRLTDSEASALLVLHYAQLVARCIKDKDRATRYRSALDMTRDNVAARLAEQAAAEGRPPAPELMALQGGEMPALPQRWDLSRAVNALVALAVTNVVEPFEIDVARAPLDALPEIAEALGFRRDAGEKIGRAITEVQQSVDRRGGVPWGRVLTVAAGVALVAAGPVGLAVAAPASVFGAAAITGGLAAFGPGGMVGGLALLGGLASTGAAVAATGVAGSSDVDHVIPDAVTLVLRVATEYARKLLDLEYDEQLWYLLANAEIQLSGQINHLSAFSDPKSAKITQLTAARTTVTRLMAFLIEKGLAPRALDCAESTAPDDSERLPVEA